MSKAVVGKRYQHYKGYEYTVLAIAHDEETLEDVVVYRAEYDTEDFGPNPIWIRKLNLFEGQVESNGSKVDRFIALD